MTANSASRRPLASSGPEDAELAGALEAYLAAREAGEAVDVERLLAGHPAIADRLRACLASLEAVEGLTAGLWRGGEGASAFEIGTLGDYRILREVGRGGMGVVYEALQISLGRRVALKVLPFAATMDPRQLQRFHNEARAAASLEHPHIVPVYGVGCERAVHFYAMKFVDGVSLAEFLARQAAPGGGDQTVPYGRPTPGADTAPQAADPTARPPCDASFYRRVAEWGAQAADALEHAHRLGVVHRDVKPANLLIDGEGQLWVTDFGLARTASDNGLTMTGDMLGTLRYMSPEQALAKHGLVDHRTDVYGLGVTLYELLTGRPAIDGPNRGEVLQAIAFDDPCAPRSLNPQVPVELETVVFKAMAKDASDRYATARELAEDLERVVRDEPVRARRPTLVQRTRRLVRKHRSVVSVAAVGLLVCLALGVGSLGWVARDRQTRREAGNHLVSQALVEAAAYQQQRRFPEALEAARKAESLAGSHPVAEVWRLRAELMCQQVRAAQAAAEKDHRLQTSLLDVGLPPEVPEVFGDSTAGAARATVEEKYAEAFREWGLDVDAVPPEEAAALVRRRPAAVVAEVVAALDAWAADRRRTNRDWRRVAGLARALDGDDQSWQRELRAIAERGRLGQERELCEAVGRLLPFGSFSDLALGEDRNRLRHLADRVGVDTAPATGLLTLARALETAGDAERAVELLRRAGESRPRDVVLHQGLGLLLARLSPPRLAEAVEWLRSARALRPDLGVQLAQTLARAGRAEGVTLLRAMADAQPRSPALANELGLLLHFRQGQVKEAEAAFRRAIQLHPDYALAHNNLGAALRDLKRTAEAEAALLKAIQLKPDLPDAHNNLGNVLRDQKKWDEAVAAYRKAIELKPDFSLAYNNLGAALQKQRKLSVDRGATQQARKLLAEASDAYRKAIHFRPNYSEPYWNLGNARRDQGHLDEAVALYRKAIQLKPGSPEAYSTLGAVLLTQNKMNEGIAAVRKAIACNPKHAPAHLNLGRALRVQRKLDEAAEALREAARIESRWAPFAWNELGETLMEQHKLAEAIAAYRKAVTLMPDLARAHHNLGVALFGLNRLDESVTAFRKAIALGPRSAQPHYRLGLALAGQGRVLEAIVAYETCIKLSPNHAPALNQLSWALATTSRLRDPERAVQLAARAVKAAPRAASYWNTLGVACYRAGQWQGAVKALGESVKLSQGGDAYDFLFLAMAHWRLGDREQARTWYDRAVRWMDKHKPKDEELLRYRAEAASLLGQGPARPAEGKPPPTKH